MISRASVPAARGGGARLRSARAPGARGTGVPASPPWPTCPAPRARGWSRSLAVEAGYPVLRRDRDRPRRCLGDAAGLRAASWSSPRCSHSSRRARRRHAVPGRGALHHPRRRHRSFPATSASAPRSALARVHARARRSRRPACSASGARAALRRLRAAARPTPMPQRSPTAPQRAAPPSASACARWRRTSDNLTETLGPARQLSRPRGADGAAAWRARRRQRGVGAHQAEARDHRRAALPRRLVGPGLRRLPAAGRRPWACSAASLGASAASSSSRAAAAAAARLPARHRLVRALAARHRARPACVGLWVSTIFALLPLLAVRRVSPLAVAPARRRAAAPLARDPAALAALLLLGLSVVALTLLQVGNWRTALWFSVGIGGAVAVLWLASLGLTRAVRRWRPGALALRVAPGAGQPASPGQPDRDGGAGPWLRRLPARRRCTWCSTTSCGLDLRVETAAPEPRAASTSSPTSARRRESLREADQLTLMGAGAHRAHAHQSPSRAPGAAHRRRLGRVDSAGSGNGAGGRPAAVPDGRCAASTARTYRDTLVSSEKLDRRKAGGRRRQATTAPPRDPCRRGGPGVGTRGDAGRQDHLGRAGPAGRHAHGAACARWTGPASSPTSSSCSAGNRWRRRRRAPCC